MRSQPSVKIGLAIGDDAPELEVSRAAAGEPQLVERGRGEADVTRRVLDAKRCGVHDCVHG